MENWIGKEVEFQRSWGCFDHGVITAVDIENDLVTVRDEEGNLWKGSEDKMVFLDDTL